MYVCLYKNIYSFNNHTRHEHAQTIPFYLLRYIMMENEGEGVMEGVKKVFFFQFILYLHHLSLHSRGDPTMCNT